MKKLSTILKGIKPNYNDGEGTAAIIYHNKNNSGEFNGKDLWDGSNLIPMKVIFQFLNTDNNHHGTTQNQVIKTLDEIDDKNIGLPDRADG